MKNVSITITKDKSGDYVAKYEVDGYSGLGCDEVAQVLSSLGSVTEKKLTAESYGLEIPIPVPVQHR